jgi:hypothetical protein
VGKKMPGNGTQDVRSIRQKKKEDVTPCSFVYASNQSSKTTT